MTTTSGIYCITHTATGRRYVGSAVNVSKRWITHKGYLRRGRHDNPILQHGWNKHGAEAFTFAVVEEVADVADLTAREQWHMDSGDSFYNIRLRAESNLGLKFSAEARAKMSAAHMGNTYCLGVKPTAETRAKMSAGKMGNTYCLGHERTAENRANTSAAMKGRKQSPAHVAARVAGRAAFFAKKGESA